jgi:hypothetical protein
VKVSQSDQKKKKKSVANWQTDLAEAGPEPTITPNLIGFFRVLYEWHAREKGNSVTADHPQTQKNLARCPTVDDGLLSKL